MKILYYTESLTSGGKERRIVELIRGLSLNPEIKIDLVLTKKDLHYKRFLPNNVKIYYTERKGLKKDPRVFYKFYKLVRKLKPDIIHVWGNLVAIYAIPTKLILRIPMINNQIANATTEFDGPFLNHKLSFPFSNLIIANSHAGLTAYKAPKNKSIVIYNGFDFARIDKLEEVPIIKNKFKIHSQYVVGMVARFSDMKDYTSYIKCANIILSKGYDVTFLCIGSGDDSFHKRMIPEQNKNNIMFLGKQNNVESIMNICDIGVLATYTEGISNALLEFSALGKPVVTNYGGGNIELVANDVTGYLVKQESPNELADKIEILLKDKNKRKTFGKNGKERVTKIFSIENMINSFENAYAKVI